MAVPGALHVMPCAGHCWWQAGMLMRTLAWPYLFIYLLLHLPSYEAGVTFFLAGSQGQPASWCI
jgi:hypothetical protein